MIKDHGMGALQTWSVRQTVRRQLTAVSEGATVAGTTGGVGAADDGTEAAGTTRPEHRTPTP